MAVLETTLLTFVNIVILLFEYAGVIVIAITGIHGIFNYISQKSDTKLILAKGFATGLEFKLGSEILRTVVVRDISEIAIVAGIIVLRAFLTFLIHWEIRSEEREHALKKDSEA